MPNQDLVAEFKRTCGHWDALGQALAPLAERLGAETVADAMPAAKVIEVRGEINEDWVRLLRIQRVLSATPFSERRPRRSDTHSPNVPPAVVPLARVSSEQPVDVRQVLEP